MLFARPWLLLLAPLLWVLYALLERARRRPIPVIIPDLSWLPPPGSASEARARRAPSVDLAIALAALAALALALAGPSLASSRELPTTALVIDRGASLGARGRGARSRALAEALIEELAPGAPVELWSSPPDPAGPWRGPAGEARSALAKRAGPVPILGDLEARLSAALLGGARVIAVVDRPPELPEELAGRIGLRSAAAAQDNWGIVAAGSRRVGEAERLSATLINAAPEPRTVSLELWAASAPGGAESREAELPLRVEPGAYGVAVFDVDPAWGLVRLRLRLDEAGADALDWDNEAVLLRRSGGALTIGLEDLRGEGPELFELRAALASIPEAAVTDGGAAEGLRVAVGRAEPGAVGPELLILPPGSGDRLAGSKEADFLPGLAGELFAEVPSDSSGFRVVRARAAPPPGLGELRPLIVTREGGEVLAGARGRGRGLLVYLGFTPRGAETSWVLRDSFPLMLLAMAEEARGAEPGALACARTGAALPGRLVSGPAGVAAGAKRALWPGLYEVSRGGRREAFSAALLDAEASRLPACALMRPAPPGGGEGGARGRGRALDGLAAAAAAGLLALLLGRRARSARGARGAGGLVGRGSSRRRGL